MNQKAREFANALMTTIEFIELKNAKAALDGKRDLRAKVDEFVKKQAGLYTSKLSEREAHARMAELESTFSSLSKIPEINRYLNAEKKFAEVMQAANKAVNDIIQSQFK